MLYLRFGPDNQPIEFPIEERVLRATVTATLPAMLTDEALLPFGYALLYPTTKNIPQATKTHRLAITDCVRDDTIGVWVRVYGLEEIDNEHLKSVRLDNKWEEVRFNRDNMMRILEWRISRCLRETRLGIETTDEIGELDAMMQQLADLTEVEDPFLINLSTIVML